MGVTVSLRWAMRCCWLTGLGVSSACGGQTHLDSQGNGGDASIDLHGSTDGGGGADGVGAGGVLATGGTADGTAAGGLVLGTGGSERDAGGQVKDAGTTRDGGPACVPFRRRIPCDQGLDCITDFRAVASRFPTCGTGATGVPFLIHCGAYDGVTMSNIDSGTDYYFDHSDGHFVGLRRFGSGGVPPCEAADPSFELPHCESPDECPFQDAGGVAERKCTGEEPLDAGPAPAFCPMPAYPRAAPGSVPASNQDQTTFTVKFVEGSHVRLVGDSFAIDPVTMLDEDPELLRCVALTVPEASCDVEALDGTLFSRFGVSVTRVFTRPEADLDAERASGRAMSGEYLDDLNLFYTVQAPTERLPALYDLVARSPIVDTVYYNSIPSTP